MKSLFEPWNLSLSLTRRFWLIFFLSLQLGNLFTLAAVPLPVYIPYLKTFLFLESIVFNSIFYRCACFVPGTRLLALMTAIAFSGFSILFMALAAASFFGIHTIFLKDATFQNILFTLLFTPIWIYSCLLLYRENIYRKSLKRVKLSQIAIEPL